MLRHLSRVRSVAVRAAQRFPAAAKTASLLASPPDSADGVIIVYKREMKLAAIVPHAHPSVPDEENLDGLIISVEALERKPVGPNTVVCPTCTLEQCHAPRCSACSTVLPRRQYSESPVWSWAGTPELGPHESECLLKIPVSARICRVISPDEGSLREDLPRLRVAATRSNDGSTAVLYSGVPDDFDGELTHFEWSELNGSISNPYLHMLQAQCEALVTMRPILVENGDKGGELVLEPSVLLQDDVVNLTKGQFAGLLKNGVKYHA